LFWWGLKNCAGSLNKATVYGYIIINIYKKFYIPFTESLINNGGAGGVTIMLGRVL